VVAVAIFNFQLLATTKTFIVAVRQRGSRDRVTSGAMSCDSDACVYGETVIISHKHHFIMLTPWKTASQTLQARLKPYDESTYPKFYYFNPRLNRVVHQHITCADLVSLPEAQLGYFVGAFVRNPYDRAYSGFWQLQRGMVEQQKWNYPDPWIGDLVRKQWLELHLQFCRAEFEFDKWMTIVGDEQIYEIGNNSSFNLHPAYYWTHVADDKIADFIGKVEAFESDFQRFISEVGIGDVEMINANVVDLKGDADSNPFGYRYVNRMNSASRNRINDLFARDFELFGYEKCSH
jgi:hypothetical protein